MQFIVLVACLLSASESVNVVTKGKLAVQLSAEDMAKAQLSVQDMAKVFDRSDKVHDAAMSAMMSSMSSVRALQVLEKINGTTPQLMQVAKLALGSQMNLRKPLKGYSGIDGARKLLNDMIYEAMFDYDKEISACTSYYATQCSSMDLLRGQISASNYIAANSRTLILDSQAVINTCEVSIPTLKDELKTHNRKCKDDLKEMKDRLAIILADLEIMTYILTLTDCKKTFISLDNATVQHKLSQLQSKVSRNLIKEAIADVMEAHQGPIINKTSFNNPPIPRTRVPRNPCTDPHAGAPRPNKGGGCTITGQPCYKLQERFLLIQAGIEDERDELMEQIAMREKYCEETRLSLETQIQDDEGTLAESQTKLGLATEKEASAGKVAIETAKEHDQLTADLRTRMKTCNDNYLAKESEICALKKIRGELYKMKGGGHSPFFQDCSMSKWEEEECTKPCVRLGETPGHQKLIRKVLAKEDGGAKCLPRYAEKNCNLQPCPVDCKISTWSAWSKCSAQCGGGVQQRVREVERAMRHEGKPCGQTSQSRACNIEACEMDCVLSDWTKWSKCSKDCDGGSRKRQKYVFKKARGQGECATQWKKERLEYKQCNMERCRLEPGELVKECNRTLDVILLIDGSGSLGRKGWKAEIKAAKLFVDAFKDSGKVNMAAILYSGPRTWSGVYKCFSPRYKVDIDKFCKIKTVKHFTPNLEKVSKSIGELKWPRGSTLTSLALQQAASELNLGRKHAKPNIIVFTDGRPLSYRKTLQASRNVRKTARLVWVPVTQYAPLKYIKKWATRRWQENVVIVKSFEDLEKPEVVTHVIADICPKDDAIVEFARR